MKKKRIIKSHIDLLYIDTNPPPTLLRKILIAALTSVVTFAVMVLFYLIMSYTMNFYNYLTKAYNPDLAKRDSFIHNNLSRGK